MKKAMLCTICLLLIASGCPPLIDKEQWLKAGYDPNYVDGYADGHSSGLVAGGHPYSHFQKDTHRYENDSQYRQGWNDGFAVGKGSYESIGRAGAASRRINVGF